ncbi:hypothetical protein HanIR_Chr15g0731191 [Helianthus annuus]|nr:hypothetical protein HanIR_Chr15g0731191 [Helianthus annuus]
MSTFDLQLRLKGILCKAIKVLASNELDLDFVFKNLILVLFFLFPSFIFKIIFVACRIRPLTYEVKK